MTLSRPTHRTRNDIEYELRNLSDQLDSAKRLIDRLQRQVTALGSPREPLATPVPDESVPYLFTMGA